ncbi:MAG: isopenicillin N synthase family dioxygenase [Heliomarina sp.]|uniref:isopenicillin N synthase family dioxygenase n=1 Tax=Heliomarina sp. TaxID=2917556 RepID=UPI0040586EBB
MIPDLDMALLRARDPVEMARLTHALSEVGFLTLHNTGLSADEVSRVIEAYRGFFQCSAAEKSAVDMSRTGSNRGWGAPKSEQVDPTANPDFKEVFDCGHELPEGHPLAEVGLSVYAPNLWPEGQEGFRTAVEAYYDKAHSVALELLRAMAVAIGEDETSFDKAFDAPMALLRGNYYPERPDWAGDKDFGIAPHTDYGCLTLLATDGVPGLEVRLADGRWQPVVAEPGRFVINFGEMLEFWTGGRAKATLHRVIGSPEERISVPLFFNPSYDTNVAPPGSGQVISAGDHLSRRFNETYLHLRKG